MVISCNSIVGVAERMAGILNLKNVSHMLIRVDEQDTMYIVARDGTKVFSERIQINASEKEVGTLVSTDAGRFISAAVSCMSAGLMSSAVELNIEEKSMRMKVQKGVVFTSSDGEKTERLMAKLDQALEYRDLNVVEPSRKEEELINTNVRALILDANSEEVEKWDFEEFKRVNRLLNTDGAGNVYLSISEQWRQLGFSVNSQATVITEIPSCSKAVKVIYTLDLSKIVGMYSRTNTEYILIKKEGAGDIIINDSEGRVNLKSNLSGSQMAKVNLAITARSVNYDAPLLSMDFEREVIECLGGSIHVVESQDIKCTLDAHKGVMDIRISEAGTNNNDKWELRASAVRKGALEGVKVQIGKTISSIMRIVQNFSGVALRIDIAEVNGYTMARVTDLCEEGRRTYIMMAVAQES